MAKYPVQLCVMVHTYNPSTQEAEAEESWVWGQPRLIKTLSQKKKKKEKKCASPTIYLFKAISSNAVFRYGNEESPQYIICMKIPMHTWKNTVKPHIVDMRGKAKCGSSSL
jgi:hypothetical protein